jgi:hypothetical protein
VRHRHLRVEVGRTAKGAGGLLMIECVNERDPLIEEALGFGIIRPDRMMVIAEAGH